MRRSTPRQKTLRYTRLAFLALCLAMLFFLGQKYRKANYNAPVLSLKINEICLNNPGTEVTQGLTYQSYIELYNPTGETISLAGLRLATDTGDNAQLLVGEIEPHGFSCIYALSEDGPEPEGSLSVRLSLSGVHTVTLTWEKIVNLATLKTEAALPVDSVPLPGIRTQGTVYARTEDGGKEFAPLRPTPGASNQTAAGLLAEQPVIETASGFYQNSVTVSMSAPDGLTIRYTLDGSTPDETSPVYQEPLHLTDPCAQPNVYAALTDIVAETTDYLPPAQAVDKAIVLRASAFDADGNYSNPVTASYFINQEQKNGYPDAWILSLTSDPDYLFSEERGIYVRGSGYEQAFKDGIIYEEFPWIELMDYMNYHREGSESERPAHLALFDEQGNTLLDQDCGIRIRGNESRSFPQKSFTLFARKRYGNSAFTSVFSDTEESCPSMILNNSQSLKKVFFFSLVSDRDTATQEYHPCQVFLDGEYWGMYFLMEKYSAEYLQNHYQVPADDILLIKDSEEVQSGKAEDFALYQEAAELLHSDLTDPDTCETLLETIDMQSLIDWLCTNIYIANTDTRPLGGNVYTWRSTRPDGEGWNDGRWRWILYDLDDSLAVGTEWENNEPWLMDTFTEHAGYYPAGFLDTEPLPALMQNEDFRRQFVLTFLDMANENFRPERVNVLLDQLKTQYADQADLSWQRWNTVPWYDSFEDQIETLRIFFENRFDAIVPALAEHFELTGDLVDLTLSIQTAGTDPESSSETDGGTVTLNTITPDLSNGSWNGRYYTDYPITLKAEPAKGYLFAGWELENGTFLSGDANEKEILVQLQESTELTAVFEAE